MCEKAEYSFCLSGEKCPLCLDYMPPVWEYINEDWSERLMPCCGKLICSECVDRKFEFLDKETKLLHRKTTTERNQIRQLLNNCPLCRAEIGDDKKEDLFMRHSAEGKGWADYGLHYYYYSEGKLSLSAKYLKLSAERGFPCALVLMFAYYNEGMAELGIRKSIESAKRALERAAMCGHAGARHDLARYYVEEKDGGLCKEGEADIEKAIQTMELAGEEGYYESFYHLGNIFRHGQYEKQDLLTAIRYYKMGSEKNNYSSWYELACLSQDGKIMEKVDYFNVAIRFFEAEGMQGHVKAQENMGLLLTRRGPIQTKLFIAGTCWLQMALNKGSEMVKGLFQDKRTEKVQSMICFNCNALAMGGESRFHRCSKCRVAHYCSKQCQKDHWHRYGHKYICGNNKYEELRREEVGFRCHNFDEE